MALTSSRRVYESADSPQPRLVVMPLMCTSLPNVSRSCGARAVARPAPGVESSAARSASSQPSQARVSGFKKTSMRPWAAAAPRLHAAPNPWFTSERIRCIQGYAAAITSAVASDEALSTTIASSFGPSVARNASRQSVIMSEWLKVTTTTVARRSCCMPGL